MLLFATVAAADGVDYSQYQVYRFHSHNHSHIIEDVVRGQLGLKTEEYDVWTRNAEFIDVQLPRSINLQGTDVSYEIVIDDLNSAIGETFPLTSTPHHDNYFDIAQDSMVSSGKYFFFKEYRPLKTIYTWLDLLEQSFPHLVTMEDIGTTFEGNPLKVVHISTKNSTMNPESKTIVITGGIHAREWVSISSVLFTIYQLLTKYGKSRRETRYLDSLDFLIIPIFNPDGYNYTWNGDRLWKKNRQDTYVPQCKGIDIDHSFPYQWEDSKEFPCSEEYSGEEALQATEARLWDTFITCMKIKHNIYGYLDFHSYSQEVLYPYAYSCDELPRDYENLLELSYGLSKAIRNKSGKKYKVLAACQDRGSDISSSLGAGTALDYMYHSRAHWAFQLKLRDSGNHGFLLPARHILDVGRETYAAVKYFCDFVLNPEH